jgi:DNA-binding transcriptional regulator YdaS (Cro superfamily)
MARRKALKLNLRNPVLRAIRQTEGTAPRIAKVCGIQPSAVWQWKQVPAHHVPAVGKLMDIPFHAIRPDVFPAN